MGKKKEKHEFTITELFMGKCGNDWDRCFYGTIRRETDFDGNPVVYTRIEVNDGYVIATAQDQWKLGEKLDQLVLMILDYGLHSERMISETLTYDTICLN